MLGDPDLVEAEEEAVGHEEFEQRLDKPGESVEWHAGASASKKKKKKKTKGLVRQEDQVPEEKKKAKKQKNDLPEDNHMHAGKKQRVEGKTKTSEPPQEDTTPPKKKAKVEMDSLQTPEKVSGGPLHVDQCRPAAFGKRQTPADTKLAKAKAPVKVEQESKPPVALDPPKKTSDAKGKTEQSVDADMELGDESDDSVEFNSRVRRKPHKRSCKKKTLSESKQKLQNAKKFLNGIGVTYPMFQRTHSRQDLYLKTNHESVRHFVGTWDGICSL